MNNLTITVIAIIIVCINLILLISIISEDRIGSNKLKYFCAELDFPEPYYQECQQLLKIKFKNEKNK